MAAEEQQQKKQKWEGKATAKIDGLKAEEIWPLFEDFCSFDKWLPSIDTCHQIEGINGQPGLVRYCASSTVNKWCHEKLIAIDPVLRCLRYEVLNNNMGFKSYVSTIKILEESKNDDEERLGCEIEWSFLADPVDGLTCEALKSYINFSLKGMAENIERALQSS